jgi:hypothetical protein
MLWKMRMELELQWDLLEEEIPTVFEEFLGRVKNELVYLKDQVHSKFIRPVLRDYTF